MAFIMSGTIDSFDSVSFGSGSLNEPGTPKSMPGSKQQNTVSGHQFTTENSIAETTKNGETTENLRSKSTAIAKNSFSMASSAAPGAAVALQERVTAGIPKGAAGMTAKKIDESALQVLIGHLEAEFEETSTYVGELAAKPAASMKKSKITDSAETTGAEPGKALLTSKLATLEDVVDRIKGINSKILGSINTSVLSSPGNAAESSGMAARIFVTHESKVHQILISETKDKTFTVINLTAKERLGEGSFAEAFAVINLVSGKDEEQELVLKSLLRPDEEVSKQDMASEVSAYQSIHSLHPDGKVAGIYPTPQGVMDYTEGANAEQKRGFLCAKRESDVAGFNVLLKCLPETGTADKKAVIEKLKAEKMVAKGKGLLKRINVAIKHVEKLTNQQLEHMQSPEFLKKICSN